MNGADKADLDDLYNILSSIDASLKALVGVSRAGRPEAPSGGPASDRDLDGPYGDPEVKMRDPKEWTGATMVGRHFSGCPAEYLDLVADRLDYFVGKNSAGTEDEQKKARYQKLDAARARGWAARIRAGKVKPAATAPDFDEESVPF